MFNSRVLNREYNSLWKRFRNERAVTRKNLLATCLAIKSVTSCTYDVTGCNYPANWSEKKCLGLRHYNVTSMLGCDLLA